MQNLTQMTNLLKKTLLLFTLFFGLHSTNVAQCYADYHEAVRNGDFEEGYLKWDSTDLTKHVSTPGGPFDFQSDMRFVDYFEYFDSNFSTTNSFFCSYGIGDQYVVAKGENFSCGGVEYVMQPFWGLMYGPLDVAFKDHTPDGNDNGFALIVDKFSWTKKVAWSQNISVKPNTTYYYSAWLANYGTGASPYIRSVVYPISNNQIDSANIDTLFETTSILRHLEWQQSAGVWTPNQAYDSVIISIEFIGEVQGSVGSDIIIDDISFSTNEQKQKGLYSITPKSLNPCINAATYSIEIYDSTNQLLNLQNSSISWFKKGIANELTAMSNQTEVSFDESGTYYFCVTGTDFEYIDSVTVEPYFSLNLPDLTLCSTNTVSAVAKSYNSDEIQTVNWLSSKNGNIQSDSISFNTADTVIVTYKNTGNFACGIKDTFVVYDSYTTQFEYDTIHYCENENFTFNTERPVSLYLDSANGKFLRNGTNFIVNSNEIPPSTSSIIQKNESFGSLNIVDVHRLASVRNSYSLLTTEIVVKQPIFITEILVLNNNSSWDSKQLTIDISGDKTWETTVNVDNTGELVYIPINAAFNPGTYTISASKNLMIPNNTTPLNYKDIIDFSSQNQFIKSMNFRYLDVSCGEDEIIFKRRNSCREIMSIIDTAKSVNVCYNDSFQLTLADTNGVIYNLSNKQIKWYESNNNEITRWNNASKINIEEVGDFSFIITDSIANAEVTGTLTVYGQTEKFTSDIVVCSVNDSAVWEQLTFNRNAITGLEWSNNSNLILDTTFKFVTYQPDTFYLKSIAKPNTNCFLTDTVVAINRIIAPDTVTYCTNQDSVELESAFSSIIYYSQNNSNTNIGHGNTLKVSTTNNFVLAKSFKAANTSDTSSTIDPDQFSFISTTRKTATFDNIQPLILREFKIASNPENSEDIEILIDNKSFTVSNNSTGIITVQCDLIVEDQFTVSSNSELNYETIPSDSVRNYWRNSEVFFKPQFFRDHDIFIYDIVYTKIEESCEAAKIVLKSSDCTVSSREITLNNTVFPNPTQGIVKLSATIDNIKVFDAHGKLVLSAGNVQQINLQSFNNGLYFVQLNNQETHRIVLNK